MALLPTGQFNADQHQDMLNFDPLPEDEYQAQLIESEMKNTKEFATTGAQYLEMKFGVLSGPFAGRFLWTRLNLVNSNAKTVEIANRELATICRAVGVLNPQQSEQLHNLPMTIKVKLSPANSQYPASNDITGYAAASGVAAYTGGGPQPAAPVPGVAPAPVMAPPPVAAPVMAPPPVAAPAMAPPVAPPPAPMAPPPVAVPVAAPVAPAAVAPPVVGAPGSPQVPVAMAPPPVAPPVAPVPVVAAPVAPAPVAAAAAAGQPPAPPWQ